MLYGATRFHIRGLATLTLEIKMMRTHVEHSAVCARMMPICLREVICGTLLLPACSSLLPRTAFAQQEATVSGVLTDPSGAGIPGASPTLTNQETSVVLTT